MRIKPYIPQWALAFLLTAASAHGDRLSFTTAEDWQSWSIPLGAVEVQESGNISPVVVRKSVDAMADAARFGGGIRGAGSNVSAAPLIVDGDPTTGWFPIPEDGIESSWVEVDLGRLVTAERVRIHFAEDGPPMGFFNVLLSIGEPFFSNALVPLENTLSYGFSQRFGFNQEHVVELDFRHRSLRIIRIEVSQLTEGARITGIEVDTIGDNVALGLVERGGSIEMITDLQAVLSGAERMVDGDIVTNWGMQTYHQTQTGETVLNRMVFDLGAHYWLDQVRIVGEPAGVPVRLRSSYANFFWYQVLASDGSRAPDGSLRWHEVAFQPSLPQNLIETRNFDHSFPLQKVRYIQHFFASSDDSGERSGTHGSFRLFALISEYQMFGEGFPGEVEMVSPIIDLGGTSNLTSIEWAGEQPANSRVEIFSRTGDDVDEEVHYYDKTGKEITQRKWEKTPSSLRGPVETAISPSDNWSIWSDPYTSSGQLFRSPSPRRYAQLRIRLISEDPEVAPTVSELHLNLENPIALQALAEVYPDQVEPGVNEEFTYFVQPTFGGLSQGYDRLDLQASVPVEFAGLRIGEENVVGEVKAMEKGFVVDLPDEIRAEEMVALSFRSTILQNRTRFDLFLGNSRLGENARQRVDEGNANELIESESISVSLPITGELLANVAVNPVVLTPNGDGVGDLLALEFDALKLVNPRPVKVLILDLAGRQMAQLADGISLAQHYQLSWDGRDARGNLVPPGSYLLRIEVEGDAQTEIAQRVVPVAY
ncbi:MAG: hypothetical protein GKR89_05585 [Candidatus Latescibacteria bacterium]|nr:hypothetical protein [Candidatus Latescibacterota bacterium]